MDAHEQLANQTFSSVDSNGPSVAGIVLECNKIAMEHLRHDNFSAALDLLKKAEQLLTFEYQQNPSEKIYRLIGITLNNLGCFYKRNEKPKVALKYLKKALVIEAATVNDESNLAGTHLNICAISSHMDNHEAALEHVRFALDLLEKARRNALTDEKGEFIIDPDTIRTSKQLEKIDYLKADHYRTIVTTMIIGYCNYGTELEYLRRYHQSAEAYSKGYELARDELGELHPMTQTLNNNFHSVLVKKKNYEEGIEKKNAHKLKLFEANKGIRYQHTRQQRFELQQNNPPRRKVVEYGYDGHKHVRTRILSKNQITHSKSTRRDHSLKLPKISGPSSAYDKSALGLDGNQTSDTRRLFIADRDQEEFEKDLKSHYNNAFTPTSGLLDAKKKAHNQSISTDIRDDTIISNRSVTKKKGNLNKTVDYGTIAADDESFFKAIDYQIKDLDTKINKTKKDILNIKNNSEMVTSLTQPGNTSNRIIPDDLTPTPTHKMLSQHRPNSLTRPPLGQTKNRPTSQESKNSDGSTVFAKKERENNKLFEMPSDPYGIGRVNSEDSEPQRPMSKQPMILSNPKQTNSERGERHDSPLFDIAQDIEKRNHSTSRNSKNMSNFILVNDNINSIKEEPAEEQRNGPRKKSGGDSQSLLNSRQSNQSQPKPKSDEKSVEQQIAEVQKSLEGYKKQLKPASLEDNPPTSTNSRGNNSGRASKDGNKPKSQNALPKPDESKEEKIDNYLKYFE